MANFKQVNFDGKTVWLNIDNVLWVEKQEDQNLMSTNVMLVGGTEIEIDEDYEELLEDWGIINKA